jgi:transposase
MLLGIPVSPGFVDKASARLSDRLEDAGFDEAMQAALAAEPALGADETPVNVLAPDADPDTGEPETGSQHVLVIRPPRREADLAAGAGIAARRGHHRDPRVLHRLPDHRRTHRLPADAAQARGHPAVRRPVIRRCRAVTKLGPGSLQSWAADVIEILREAHRLVEEARARAGPVDAEPLAKLRQRYDEAVAFGIAHNRLRDWHDGNHPGYGHGDGRGQPVRRIGRQLRTQERAARLGSRTARDRGGAQAA